MDREINQQSEYDTAEWTFAPTVLGAVAGTTGTMTRNEDVLTGTVCGNTMCDMCTDWARA